ncbi:MAG: endo alpha-1,4 polygalactosaminidase [Anaerolineae bacterium]|nr:endo alpha-1,4 polygalactosaminidase [Anaerolineae bacterium]
MRQVASFACYYGLSNLAKLAGYSLVILQAENYTPKELAWLADQGVTVVAYVSVGEESTQRPDPTWLLRDVATGEPVRNNRWGTFVVDCRSVSWRRYLLEQRLPTLLARGAAGLFLDTVDVQEAYPATRQGVIELLHSVRRACSGPLVVNRGFAILDTVLAVSDAIVFEAFTSYYDGEAYRAWEGTDLAWTAQVAVRLDALRGVRPVLALDYASPADTGLRQRAQRRAEVYGFPSFVTTHALDWLP